MANLSAVRYADDLKPGRTLMDYVNVSIKGFLRSLRSGRHWTDSEEAKSFQWDHRREGMSTCRWIGRIFRD